VLLAILGTGTVWAQSTGTFTQTGNMTTGRWDHTATLLPSGKVLIAGGWTILGSSSSITASAELYDPSTGTFTATGDMTTGRAGHTATLLPNGKVLITSGGLASAELYDPSTETFTATGDMITAASFATATLLADGRVLIADDPNGHPPAAAELYDPVSGTFSATGDMITPWSEHPTTTLLPNGRVLIVTCCTQDQLYDPESGTFSLTGATTRVGGDGFTAALLTNGKVLLAGGDAEISQPPGTAGAELYDPSTGTFTATGNMTTRRFYHTATLLPDGTVLIAGSLAAFDALASAELYDPATGTFSATGSMITRRWEHTATLLNDGKVLIAGGRGSDNGILAGAELYNPPLLVPAPVLFSLSGDGQGQGAILHASTHQVVSSTNPAIVGEALEIYCTGLTDGSVIPPQVAISGRMAEVLFFGKAPGWASLNQVDVRVPSGVSSGPVLPVRLTYLGRTSNEVTIGGCGC